MKNNVLERACRVQTITGLGAEYEELKGGEGGGIVLPTGRRVAVPAGEQSPDPELIARNDDLSRHFMVFRLMHSQSPLVRGQFCRMCAGPPLFWSLA